MASTADQTPGVGGRAAPPASPLPPDLAAFVADVQREFGATTYTVPPASAFSEAAEAIEQAATAQPALPAGVSARQGLGTATEPASSDAPFPRQDSGKSDGRQEGFAVGAMDSFLRARAVKVRRRLKAVDEFYKAAGYAGAIFETCTYAKRGGDVDPKEDISHHCDARRAWWRRRHPDSLPLEGRWVAEPQMDGTVHYHIVWWVPAKARRWELPMNVWRHGRSEVRWVRKSVVGYLSKYLAKVPYGVTDRQRAIKVRLSGEAWARLRIYYRKLRTYAVDVPGDKERERFESLPGVYRKFCVKLGLGGLERRKGGGWWMPGCGQWVESAYEVVGCAGGFVFMERNPKWQWRGGVLMPEPGAFHDASEVFEAPVMRRSGSVGDAAKLRSRSALKITGG